MDINELRLAVNSLSPDELQNFANEAQVRTGVAVLLGSPVRGHLLAATMQLVHERLVSLGIKPRFKEPRRPAASVHDIDRRLPSRGRNGKVKVTKVSHKEMEKLWKTLQES